MPPQSSVAPAVRNAAVIAPVRTKAADRRRVNVLTVAEELFVVRGFAGTTVDTIAARSGEARSTIFEQIGRKIDLLALVAERADERGRAVITDERAAERRSARRRQRGHPRPTPVLPFRTPESAAAHRTAHNALVRNTHTALLTPVLTEALHAGEVEAGRILRRWSANRRHVAAAALRTSRLHPRTDLTEGIAELIGPWPYLGLVIGRGWTPGAYERWLERSLRPHLSRRED